MSIPTIEIDATHIIHRSLNSDIGFYKKDKGQWMQFSRYHQKWIKSACNENSPQPLTPDFGVYDAAAPTKATHYILGANGHREYLRHYQDGNIAIYKKGIGTFPWEVIPEMQTIWMYASIVLPTAEDHAHDVYLTIASDHVLNEMLRGNVERSRAISSIVDGFFTYDVQQTLVRLTGKTIDQLKYQTNFKEVVRYFLDNHYEPNDKHLNKLKGGVFIKPKDVPSAPLNEKEARHGLSYSQGTNRLIRHLTSLAPQPCIKEGDIIMNLITKHFVNDVDMSSLTQDKAFQLIRDTEKEIADLKAIKSNSRAIKARIKELEQTLGKFIELMDADIPEVADDSE